jgi:hypothetical protein
MALMRAIIEVRVHGPKAEARSMLHAGDRGC